MLRVFYILSILLSIILIGVSATYMGKVSDARSESYNSYSYSPYDSGSQYQYDDYRADKDMTVEAGKITLPFFAFFLALAFITLLKLKTKTMKVLSIIALVLSALMIVWDFLMMDSPGGVSFDEAGGGWIFFALVELAFSIIGTIHAFRKKA
ncbi:MAG: hypothetical protein K0S33_4302 [Bacteroidetes bacterium]|jgi:hypothetical protein|nr:hypothetical protein [Bacteroidota bacterium]